MNYFKTTLVYIVLLFMNGTVYSQISLFQFDDNNAQNTGLSTLTDRLGTNQKWEILTLILGNNEFIFRVDERKPTDVKTFRVSNSGNYQYSMISESLNRDNREYIYTGAGEVYFDITKNYKMGVYLNRNTGGLYLKIEEIRIANHSYRNPNPNDGRLRRYVPVNNINFLRNGQKPIALLLLDDVPNEKFYIYADGVIKVYNWTNNTLGICGQQEAPFYQTWNGINWSWVFRRNIGNNRIQTYFISTTGGVWAMAVDGSFNQYGYVTYVDF